MGVQFIRTEGGEELVVLPRAEFEALHEALEESRDAVHHAAAMADLRAGRDEALTFAQAEALLAAPTPLAFWRERRGLTRPALAARAGVAEADLAAIEDGHEGGRLLAVLKLARALGVDVEELVPAEG